MLVILLLSPFLLSVAASPQREELQDVGATDTFLTYIFDAYTFDDPTNTTMKASDLRHLLMKLKINKKVRVINVNLLTAKPVKKRGLPRNAF